MREKVADKSHCTHGSFCLFHVLHAARTTSFFIYLLTLLISSHFLLRFLILIILVESILLQSVLLQVDFSENAADIDFYNFYAKYIIISKKLTFHIKSLLKIEKLFFFFFFYQNDILIFCYLDKLPSDLIKFT